MHTTKGVGDQQALAAPCAPALEPSSVPRARSRFTCRARCSPGSSVAAVTECWLSSAAAACRSKAASAAVRVLPLCHPLPPAAGLPSAHTSGATLLGAVARIVPGLAAHEAAAGRLRRRAVRRALRRRRQAPAWPAGSAAVCPPTERCLVQTVTVHLPAKCWYNDEPL